MFHETSILKNVRNCFMETSDLALPEEAGTLYRGRASAQHKHGARNLEICCAMGR